MRIHPSFFSCSVSSLSAAREIPQNMVKKVTTMAMARFMNAPEGFTTEDTEYTEKERKEQTLRQAWNQKVECRSSQQRIRQARGVLQHLVNHRPLPPIQHRHLL